MNAPAPDTESTVELRDVSIGSSPFPGVILVERVQWRIARGDYWVVGGRPGAGKSELLQTAAGLLPAERGEALLFGRSVAGLSEEEMLEIRRRIGFVFGQGGRLLNRHSVIENLTLPVRYHRNCGVSEAIDWVGEVLDLLELHPWADHRPDRTPRHLHARISLARALVLRPELLMVDNPLAGLEPGHMRWWLDFLERLNQRAFSLFPKPMTLAVSTNNFWLWRGRPTRFGMIDERQWIEFGAAEELFHGPYPAARDLMLGD